MVTNLRKRTLRRRTLYSAFYTIDVLPTVHDFALGSKVEDFGCASNEIYKAWAVPAVVQQTVRVEWWKIT